MKKLNSKEKAFLEDLMAQFNDYSELVALNYRQKKEGKFSEQKKKDKFTEMDMESMLQWNRGSLNKIEEHLEVYAEMIGVNLVFAYGPHPFLNREPLEYRTVHLEGEDTNYRRTTVCDIKIR